MKQIGFYPVHLHVAWADEKAEELFERVSGKRVEEPEDKWNAYASEVLVHKETRLYAVLVVLTEEVRGLGTLVHEAVHVAQAVWKHIGEGAIGGEADAYLTEYIFNEIHAVYEARTSKGEK